MNNKENPFAPTAIMPLENSPGTPIAIQRVRFAVSMWVCGVVGIACAPVFPWNPSYWAAQGVPFGIHWAWLGPFCCSVASIVTAVALFTLPGWMDKLGAICAIAVVGWMPGWLAISWWLYFATQ